MQVASSRRSSSRRFSARSSARQPTRTGPSRRRRSVRRRGRPPVSDDGLATVDWLPWPLRRTAPPTSAAERGQRRRARRRAEGVGPRGRPSAAPADARAAAAAAAEIAASGPLRRALSWVPSPLAPLRAVGNGRAAAAARATGGAARRRELALLAHSHELNRRLARTRRGSSAGAGAGRTRSTPADGVPGRRGPERRGPGRRAAATVAARTPPLVPPSPWRAGRRAPCLGGSRAAAVPRDTPVSVFRRRFAGAGRSGRERAGAPVASCSRTDGRSLCGAGPGGVPVRTAAVPESRCGEMRARAATSAASRRDRRAVAWRLWRLAEGDRRAARAWRRRRRPRGQGRAERSRARRRDRASRGAQGREGRGREREGGGAGSGATTRRRTRGWTGGRPGRRADAGGEA